MIPRNETPLLRFLLAFIAGILIAVYFPVIPVAVTYFITGICLVVFYFLFAWKRKKYRNRWIAPLTGYVFTFFSGYLLTNLNTDKNFPSHFRNHPMPQGFFGLVTQPISEKEKSYKTTLKIISLKEANSQMAVSGNCLAYFSKDSLSSRIKYGDLIYFSESPAEVKPPANPAQFDYKRWLGFNHIYDQVFLREGKWKLVEQGKGNWLFAFSFSLRDKLLNIFSENKISGQEHAVLSALILGQDDAIDQEVISAYAASGALHVLSVSGLHVGIIYVAINFLLSFLDKKRKTKIGKSILIILFLWFYALLTGLSPSVLRSATMLSFIVVGSLKRHYTQLFNTLAASAFFLLCFDPFLIMQVGFQLSYTAVLGIILLYQNILNWFDPPGWLLRQIWSITAVSLAAQIATFPLGFLYFNQFPVYFLLSNLIVIPISTVIIYGGISLLAFSEWHAVAALLATALSWVVHGMNAIVLWIENLPLSLVTGISVSVIDTCLIYILIASILAFCISANQKYLLTSFFTVVLFISSQIAESIIILRQEKMIVYQIKGYSVLNFIDGRKNFLYADEALTKDRGKMIFNIYPYWWICGLDERKFEVIRKNRSDKEYLSCGNFIQYGETKIVFVNEVLKPDSTTIIPVDIVMISNNSKIKLKELIKIYHFRKIVVDSSNSLKTASRLIQEANELGIEIYSVLHQGAFVYNLQRK